LEGGNGALSSQTTRYSPQGFLEQALKMTGVGEVLAIEPRGLSRVTAAAYIGVSPALFDEMVSDGRMPSPKRVNSRTVWDRKRLDEAFEALPDKASRNPWDEERAA
jgi:predicted DNA-binding transcriptional regulator AlpA